jgi:transposase-like protein
MAHKLERIDAKRYYCEESKEVSEIARLLNVPESTIRRWKSQDAASGNDWDKEREALRTTSYSMVKQMMLTLSDRLEKMSEEIKASGKINPSEVYAFRQLVLSVKSLEKEDDPYAAIMRFADEYTSYLGEHYPEELQRQQEYIVEFGAAMSKKYRRK